MDAARSGSPARRAIIDLIAGKGQQSLTRATPAPPSLTQYESPRTVQVAPQVPRLERLYASPSVSPRRPEVAPQVPRLERLYASPSVSPSRRTRQNLPSEIPDLPEEFVQALQEYAEQNNMTPELEDLAGSIIQDGPQLDSPDVWPDLIDENSIPVSFELCVCYCDRRHGRAIRWPLNSQRRGPGLATRHWRHSGTMPA